MLTGIGRLLLVGLLLASAAAVAQETASEPPAAVEEAAPPAEATAPSPAPEAEPPAAPRLPGTGALSALTADTGANDGDPLDPETLRRVVATLEDETERRRLLETLRALAAVEAAEPAAEPPLVARQVEQLRGEVEARIDAAQQALGAVLNSTAQLEYFATWLNRQVSNPSRRQFWARTLGQIAVVLGVAVAVGWVARRLLWRVRTPFESYAPPTPLHFAGAIAVHAAVRLVPIGVFVGVAALTAYALDLGAYTFAVTRSLVEGFAFVTAVTAIVRAVLNFKNPHMRLFPVEEAVGASIQRGIVRTITVAGYGYFGLQAARALGLPWTLHGFLEQILFFVTLILFIRLVLRFRELGADGLRAVAGQSRSGLVGRFLPWAWLARFWHLVAIGFGVVVWLSWALDIGGGPAFLFRALLITAVLLFLTRLINVWLTERALARGEPRRVEEGEEQELTDVIATAAQSPLSFVLRLSTTALALGLILQAWGADVWGWLQSDAGEALRDAVTAAALTLGVAYVLWKLINAFVRGAIEETDRLGRPVRSNRSRTLLTIGRNFIFVIIWLTAGMLALSELGVNLAPLIAGAGVIGLAVGFGSQQLVQDIITGFFILVEDTIAVGDVADLGGKVGVVEAVTLRTVRLRGYDGQVHTVPYSKISTISNLTKDFSYYVFDVGVAYKEDADRVMRVMAEVGAEMQRERAYRRLIVEPLEIAGVDRFADSAVVIKARFKTRPLQQWTIGREYNRRLKKRFDELGIEIPFPQRTLHLSGHFPGQSPGHFPGEAPAESAPAPAADEPATVVGPPPR